MSQSLAYQPHRLMARHSRHSGPLPNFSHKEMFPSPTLLPIFFLNVNTQPQDPTGIREPHHTVGRECLGLDIFPQGAKTWVGISTHSPFTCYYQATQLKQFSRIQCQLFCYKT